MSAQVWFITGASSGFGRSMVEHVLAQGDVAIALVRNPASMSDLTAKLPASRLLVIKADVSKLEDITSAFTVAQKEFQRIDVVFNNAGVSFLSEVESSPLNLARTMFDTNFWGAASVSTEAVKFFRDVNKPAGGRLLVNTSGAGFTVAPMMGYYSASKHALEAITEALKTELKPEWGIKINIIEPGWFASPGFTVANMNIVPQLPVYEGGLTTHIRAYFTSATPPNSTVKGAKAIYEIAHDPEAAGRIPLGSEAVEPIQKRAAQLVEELADVGKWSKDLAV